MFPSSLRSYGGKRKDSAIRTLVAETLVLAKTHGCVEKIESELEEELRRDSKGPPTDPLSKWRRKGDKALKSKYVLLTVALFCVTDCALVLGELILDLHKVKDTLETSERAIRQFKLTLHEAYPTEILDVEADIKEVFDKIVRSRIIWHSHHDNSSSNSSLPSSASGNSSASSPTSSDIAGVPSFSSSSSVSSAFLAVTGRPSSRDAQHARGARSVSGVSEVREYVVVYEEIRDKDARKNRTSQVEALPEGQGFSAEGGSPSGTGAYVHGQDGDHKKGHVHSLEEEVAHALHMVSISMMACLVFETLLKAFCAGLPFFKRRLETFDFFIVIVSFVVDLAFMQILPRFKIQDFVFILAFLLPWRVIRVVNSLVVAVQDHEHFRLKLVYSRKKKIQNSLRETEVKLQLFRAQCCALKRLCINEGVEEAKIEQIVQLDEYVVNKTGKSKCKVKIDNSSVILLDKSDFPRLSPRPSLSCLVEKRRSTQVEGGKGDGKCDKSPKKSALKDSPLRRGTLALVSSAECLKKDQHQSLFANGPRKKRWNLLGLGRDGTVKRAGSFSQICQKPAQLDGIGDLLSAQGADGKVKRAGSHSLLCGSSTGLGEGLGGRLAVSMEERDEDDASSSLALAASPADSLFIVDELIRKQVRDDAAREGSSATNSPSGAGHPSYLPSPVLPNAAGEVFNPNLLQAPEFRDTFTDVSADKVHDIEKAPSLPHLDEAEKERNVWVELKENRGDGTQRERHPSVFDRGKHADDVVSSGDQDAELVEGRVTFTLSLLSNVSAPGESLECDVLGKRSDVASCQATEEETPLGDAIHLREPSEVRGDLTPAMQTSGVELTLVEDGICGNGLVQDVKKRDPGHVEMTHVPLRACEHSHSAREDAAPNEDDEILRAARECVPIEEDCVWPARPEPDVAILDVAPCSSTVRTETRMQNGFGVPSADSVDQVIQTNGLPHMYK